MLVKSKVQLSVVWGTDHFFNSEAVADLRSRVKNALRNEIFLFFYLTLLNIRRYVRVFPSDFIKFQNSTGCLNTCLHPSVLNFPRRFASHVKTNELDLRRSRKPHSALGADSVSSAVGLPSSHRAADFIKNRSLCGFTHHLEPRPTFVVGQGAKGEGFHGQRSVVQTDERGTQDLKRQKYVKMSLLAYAHLLVRPTWTHFCSLQIHPSSLPPVLPSPSSPVRYG